MIIAKIVTFFVLYICSQLVLPLRQILREQLVKLLIELKHPLSLEVSDWTFTSNGYGQAVKYTYIWGDKFKQIENIPQAKKIIYQMRLLGILEWVFYILIFGIFGSFFYEFSQT